MATGALFSYVGEYRSVAGVMNPLSCYCSNGGYLVTPEGEEIAVCLPPTQQIPECTTVRVTGQFIVQQRENQKEDPCPVGKMRFLDVKRIGCL